MLNFENNHEWYIYIQGDLSEMPHTPILFEELAGDSNNFARKFFEVTFLMTEDFRKF